MWFRFYRVFSHFHKFKTLVKKATGWKIWCIRSDGGRKYFSNELMAFLWRTRIWCQLTTIYNAAKWCSRTKEPVHHGWATPWCTRTCSFISSTSAVHSQWYILWIGWIHVMGMSINEDNVLPTPMEFHHLGQVPVHPSGWSPNIQYHWSCVVAVLIFTLACFTHAAHALLFEGQKSNDNSLNCSIHSFWGLMTPIHLWHILMPVAVFCLLANFTDFTFLSPRINI